LLMPRKINSPSIIKAAGNKPKIIEEFIGRVNSKTDEVSIARMKSPGGWIEPGQAPNFDEYTVVLTGELHIKTREDDIVLKEGEAVITKKGEWI
jgi:ethanolamine utilization protein EutQ (cupin superfamily)